MRPAQVKIVRLFRAVRYSEAIRSMKSLRTSIYLLSSLITLLWFTLFVYAVAGMVLFKDQYDRYDAAVADGRVKSRENFAFHSVRALKVQQDLISRMASPMA